MIRSQIISTFLLAALLSLPVQGWAQESGSADTATESEAGAAEGQAEENAAEAPVEGASEAPQPGDITVTQHGDWELRCESETNCFMYQLTRDEQLNPVAELSIVALPEGGQATTGVTVVTPLGTLLTEGLLLQVDGGKATKYDFGWCNRAGCFARFGLTAQELDNMRRGNVARLRIVAVSAPDRPVVLNVSLTGFTAAYKDLGSRKPAE